MSLKFAALRLANTIRLPLFKNSKGETAHSHPTGADWWYVLHIPGEKSLEGDDARGRYLHLAQERGRIVVWARQPADHTHDTYCPDNLRDIPRYADLPEEMKWLKDGWPPKVETPVVPGFPQVPPNSTPGALVDTVIGIAAVEALAQLDGKAVRSDSINIREVLETNAVRREAASTRISGDHHK